jgi:hypothetical protein
MAEYARAIRPTVPIGAGPWGTKYHHSRCEIARGQCWLSAAVCFSAQPRKIASSFSSSSASCRMRNRLLLHSRRNPVRVSVHTAKTRRVTDMFLDDREMTLAKKRKRKYSKGSGEEVRREMHRYKRGTAKSGKGGKGGKVKSRKQAIAIALSKARKKGKKAPKKKS